MEGYTKNVKMFDKQGRYELIPNLKSIWNMTKTFVQPNRENPTMSISIPDENDAVQLQRPLARKLKTEWGRRWEDENRFRLGGDRERTNANLLANLHPDDHRLPLFSKFFQEGITGCCETTAFNYKGREETTCFSQTDTDKIKDPPTSAMQATQQPKRKITWDRAVDHQAERLIIRRRRFDISASPVAIDETKINLPLDEVILRGNITYTKKAGYNRQRGFVVNGHERYFETIPSKPRKRSVPTDLRQIIQRKSESATNSTSPH